MVCRAFSITTLSALNGTAFGFAWIPAGRSGPRDARRRIAFERNVARGTTARAVLAIERVIASPSSGWRLGAGVAAFATAVPASVTDGDLDFVTLPFTTFAGGAGAGVF